MFSACQLILVDSGEFLVKTTKELGLTNTKTIRAHWSKRQVLTNLLLQRAFYTVSPQTVFAYALHRAKLQILLSQYDQAIPG